MLGSIWNSITGIFDKIKELVTFIGNILNYLNPFSENFILKGVLDFLGNIISYLNPFDENFILKNVLNFLGNIISYLNPFDENFILKGVLNFLGNIISYLNPFSENFILKKLFEWLGDFFVNLFEFFVHIFVPTEEQWNAIKQDYVDLRDSFKDHLPFVGLFSNELENAKQVVYNEDFLNLKFASWSFDLGIIHFTTPDINFKGVLNAYENYRMTIRTLLTFFVYVFFLVYIIKYVLKYGVTSGDSSSFINKGDG